MPGDPTPVGQTGPPIVVKVSGKVGESYGAVAADVAALFHSGRALVLVHGGSAAIDEVSRHRGIAPQRVVSASGIEGRYTTEGDIDTLLMATAGLVNKNLVLHLHRHGITSVGLSGLDGGLLRGPRKDVLRIVENGKARLLRGNHSGDVDRVDAELLRLLIRRGAVPVVAPLALSWDDHVMNVDGDRVAAAVASSIGAQDLVLLSDVPGVMDAAGGVVLAGGDLVALREQLMPAARGRMRIKLLAAQSALKNGVARVAIASAQVPSPISAALSGGGTHLHLGDADGAG